MDLPNPLRSIQNLIDRTLQPPLDWLARRQTVLLRIGIILAAIGGAAILGFIGGRLDPMFALAGAVAPFFLLGSDQLGQRRYLYPILILAAGLFIPFALPTGTSSRLVISLVLTCAFLGIWVLNMISAEKRLWIHPSPTNAPLLTFMAVTVISYVWSLLFRDPLVNTWGSFGFVQLASTVVMVALPGVYLLTANHLNNPRALRWLAGIMIAAGVSGLLRNYGRVPLTVNMNGLFSLWVIALTAAMGLFNRQMNVWLRAGMLLVAGAWVYWGFVLHISWLAGWLPGLVAVAIIVVMRSRLLTLACIALVIVFALVRWDFVSTEVQSVLSAETAESGLTRLAAWEVNWRVTGQHWLFGTGPGGYAAYYMTYFPFEGTATHSNFIDVLAQTGLAGLAACLWFFGALIFSGFRLTQRLSGRGDFEEAMSVAVFAGAIGAFIMMGFGDWLFPFAYTQTIAGFDYAAYNWLFMGAIPVLDRLTRSTTHG